MPIDVHAHYIPPQLIDLIDRTGSDIGVRLVSSGKPGCKYVPNIDPTSSSAHPVDIVRTFRMAEEPAPALVAPPMKRRKPYWIKHFDQRGRGANIARDFTVMACWQPAKARLRVAI